MDTTRRRKVLSPSLAGTAIPLCVSLLAALIRNIRRRRKSRKTAMQIKTSPKVHDVIVIGSGAAGGMAAWNLTRKGVNVLILDAGQKFERSKFWTHVKPWEWQQRMDRG